MDSTLHHVAKPWGAAVMRARGCNVARVISGQRMPGMTGVALPAAPCQVQPDRGCIMPGCFALGGLGEVEL